MEERGREGEKRCGLVEQGFSGGVDLYPEYHAASATRLHTEDPLSGQMHDVRVPIEGDDVERVLSMSLTSHFFASCVPAIGAGPVRRAKIAAGLEQAVVWQCKPLCV